MDPSTITSVEDIVVLVSLNDIAPHPFNPAHRMDPTSDENRELQASIVVEAAKHGPGRGVRQPIKIHPVPGELAGVCGGRKYVCGDGHRRLGASGITHQPAIRALVEELSGAEILAEMISANAQREQMPPCAEARQIQQYIRLSGDSQDRAAQRFGKTQSWAARRLPLLLLPAEYQDEIDSSAPGTLSAAAGYELRRLADYPRELRRIRKATNGKDAIVIRDAVDKALADLNGGAKDGRGRKRSAVETFRQIIRRSAGPLRSRPKVTVSLPLSGELYADGRERLGKELYPFLIETATTALRQEIERRQAAKETK